MPEGQSGVALLKIQYTSSLNRGRNGNSRNIYVSDFSEKILLCPLLLLLSLSFCSSLLRTLDFLLYCLLDAPESCCRAQFLTVLAHLCNSSWGSPPKNSSELLFSSSTTSSWTPKFVGNAGCVEAKLSQRRCSGLNCLVDHWAAQGPSRIVHTSYISSDLTNRKLLCHGPATKIPNPLWYAWIRTHMCNKGLWVLPAYNICRLSNHLNILTEKVAQAN